GPRRLVWDEGRQLAAGAGVAVFGGAFDLAVDRLGPVEPDLGCNLLESFRPERVGIARQVGIDLPERFVEPPAFEQGQRPVVAGLTRARVVLEHRFEVGQRARESVASLRWISRTEARLEQAHSAAKQRAGIRGALLEDLLKLELGSLEVRLVQVDVAEREPRLDHLRPRTE